MPTVLILDGELSRRQHLVKLITNIDPQIHIETFVKAEAALAWLHWHPADLVVSDSQFADIRQAVAGDPCPRCVDGKLESWRGIEVGHVFKLGTKYSEAMNATVLDDQGKSRPLVMGCYGIGVGRTVAAAIEQNHDEHGMALPMPLAPFQVLVSMVNPKNAAIREASESIYQQLLDLGVEVLLDDRDERPGIKFKDADLIGIPLRLTVGARNLKEGNVELKMRASGEQSLLPLADAARELQRLVVTALNR